jgi:hypothetical protein
MANSSSSASSSSHPPTEIISTFSNIPNFSQLFKLEGPNYLAWVAQFQPILRVNDLQGLIEGTDICPPQFITNEDNTQTLNPAFVAWQKRDQLLLSWIICSLSPSLVSSMYGLNTSHQAWTALATRYASQSKSRISHLKRQLQNLQQGDKTCTEYLSMAKQWPDQLVAVGKPIDDDDLISFIVSGLNPLFHTFVTIHSFAARDHEMSFTDFQSELLSHELLLQNQQHSALTPETGIFALYSKQGQPNHNHLNSTRNRFNSRFSPKPHPRSQHFSQQFSPRNASAYPAKNNTTPHQSRTSTNTNQWENSNLNSDQPPRPACQICGKHGHNALNCYHRMDYTYQGRHPPTKLASMVAQMNADFETKEWLADSGANAHITGDPANINEPQPFEGADTVGIGNGTGLNIKSIGSSHVQSTLSNKSQFLLKDVLHCPNAAANLLSINKFCIDNNCWFALTGSNFTVKDNLTGRVLLQGPSENGLYPIPLHQNSLNKWKGVAAYIGVKTTDMVWHQRLGHPSLSVFQLLSKNQLLPLTGSVDKARICEACQLGKSKQQPFCESTRCTTNPLELVHSDVWTSPISSLSGCKYYVLFVDDYSRFTWLYPILNKSDVYQCFVKFKLLTENLFSTKIKKIPIRQWWRIHI